jgi:hypothetical protein
MEINTKITTFWPGLTCSSETAQYFGGKYRPHLQSRSVSASKKPIEAGPKIYENILLMVVSCSVYFLNLQTEVIFYSEMTDGLLNTRPTSQKVIILNSK